jgi:DNA-binding NarL/FixJ family response regulator
VAEVVNARPDVVMIDVDFHHCDPIETAKGIKQGCPSARVCLIALEPRTELLTRGLAVRALDGFILKDISTWDLCRALVSMAEGQPYVDARVAGKVLRGLDKGASGRASQLSERERDVIRLIAMGLSNKEIS